MQLTTGPNTVLKIELSTLLRNFLIFKKFLSHSKVPNNGVAGLPMFLQRNSPVAESTDPAILNRPTWPIKLSNMAIGSENCLTRN